MFLHNLLLPQTAQFLHMLSVHIQICAHMSGFCIKEVDGPCLEPTTREIE